MISLIKNLLKPKAKLPKAFMLHELPREFILLEMLGRPLKDKKKRSYIVNDNPLFINYFTYRF